MVDIQIEPLGRNADDQRGGFIGYDLSTGDVVLPAHETRRSWAARGTNGICLGCFTGEEGTPPGTQIPLIYKQGPAREAHFAHPAGLAPDGIGLSAETVWHIEAKRLLQLWALAQPDVRAADCEWTVQDRSRRADVLITFADGRQLALEVQQRLIDRDEWQARRASYQQLGIPDIWLWSPAIARPNGWDEPSGAFVIDPRGSRLGLIVGRPRKRKGMWFTKPDLTQFVHHAPPRPGHYLAAAWTSIEQWALTPANLQPHDAVRTYRSRDLTDAEQGAARARAAHIEAWQKRERERMQRHGMPGHTRSVLRGPRQRSTPQPPKPTSPLRCAGCGLSLDQLYRERGRHPGC